MAAFNRGSLDVPAGFLTPRTSYSLNGRSYESILGGSDNDPLSGLLARGAAGYRTAAKALQYALQSPRIVLESLSEPDAAGVRTAAFRMEGQLREGDRPFASVANLRICCAKDELTSVDVACAEADLAQIARSRRA